MSPDKNPFIMIKAVGDICPGDKAIQGIGTCSKTKIYGADFPFEKIREELACSDIVLANLEGLLSRSINSEGNEPLTFCGIPGFADAMVRSGIRVLNVANNHMLEHGEEIFHETIGILRDAGLSVCGLRSLSDKYYSEPVILSLKGKRIGVIGYNWVGIDKFPGSDSLISQSRDSIVNYTWERESKAFITNDASNIHVRNDIRKLRKHVDIVILMAHWGYEFVTVPPNGVISEAHSFIESGADLIIGSHPHVLHGVERYRNKLIVYSLGNFIFDMPFNETRKSSIIEITVTSDNVIEYGNIPCIINRNFQPERAEGQQAISINNVITDSSQKILSAYQKDDLNDDRLYRIYERMYRVLKIRTILAHLMAVRQRPSIIRVIFIKGLNFLMIVFARMKGKRVRW